MPGGWTLWGLSEPRQMQPKRIKVGPGKRKRKPRQKVKRHRG